MPIILWDVVRTVELEPFLLGDDSLHFRVEVQQRAGEPVFRARVYRIEAFEMQPSFPSGTTMSTEFLLLSDDSYTTDRIATTAAGALDHVLAELERQFGAAT